MELWNSIVDNIYQVLYYFLGEHFLIKVGAFGLIALVGYEFWAGSDLRERLNNWNKNRDKNNG